MMLGITPYNIFILWASVISFYTDIKYRKIYNWITLPTLFLTWLTYSWYGEYNTLVTSLKWTCIIFSIGIPLGSVGVIGWGDVKLWMVYGALYHTEALRIGYYALILGAILGVGKVVIRGYGKALYHNVKNFFIPLWYPGCAYAPLQTTPHSQFPFGTCLVMGWMLYHLKNYFFL